MDSSGTLTWLIPKKEIFTQKISYTYPKKTNFSNKTIFHTFQICFKKPILHPKKTFLILTLKKESIYHLKKYFFVIKQKASYTPNKKRTFSKQKIFQTKSFLYLCKKIQFCFRCVLKAALLFLRLANLDTQITLPLCPRTNIQKTLFIYFISR